MSAKPVATLIGIPSRVYDGDSIFFGRVEVRLEGIDAPELGQACKDKSGKFWPCGIKSRDGLIQMSEGKTLHCTISGKDKYKRLLGTCFTNGHDLNAAMVKRGLAISYHHFSEAYAPQELYAKARQRGIWQDAHFTDPYYCRHLQDGHICYTDEIADVGFKKLRAN